MRADKRIIFPSDRDILEEENKDELRDKIYSLLKDKSDVVGKKLIIDYGSSYIVKFTIFNGKLNGLVRCLDKDDNVISVTQYVNDVKHGLYMKYDVTGWVSCCGTYNKGRCYGTWKYYDVDGTVIREEKY